MTKKELIRILNTDLDGESKLYNALRTIKGVDFQFSNAIITKLNLGKEIKINELSPEQTKKIEDFIKNPEGIPIYLLNRQKDPETGETRHLSTTDIKFKVENDIKIMQKIKSYRGMRHAAGQPVRGQKTKAHFRKGNSMGVAKKKLPAKAPASAKEKK